MCIKLHTYCHVESEAEEWCELEARLDCTKRETLTQRQKLKRKILKFCFLYSTMIHKHLSVFSLVFTFMAHLEFI